MTTLGARIKARRKELGWTLDVLAAKTGLSKSYLSELENHKRGVGADTLKAIGDAIGLSLDQLTAREGSPDAPPNGRAALEIPEPLAKYADAAGLPFREVLLLIRLRACLPDRPSENKRAFDWQKFHEAIGEFIR